MLTPEQAEFLAPYVGRCERCEELYQTEKLAHSAYASFKREMGAERR